MNYNICINVYVPASRRESRPNMGHCGIRTKFSAGTRTAVDKAHAKNTQNLAKTYYTTTIIITTTIQITKHHYIGLLTVF